VNPMERDDDDDKDDVRRTRRMDGGEVLQVHLGNITKSHSLLDIQALQRVDRFR
jgi:hypothetical protein